MVRFCTEGTLMLLQSQVPVNTQEKLHQNFYFQKIGKFLKEKNTHLLKKLNFAHV